MKKNEKQISVAVYIRAEKQELEELEIDNERRITTNLLEQEKVLREYCKERNYNIVKIYKDNPHENWAEEDIKAGIKELLIDSFKNKFEKVIMIDLYNIDIDSKNVAYYIGVINNNNIDIETIHSGIYLNDFDFNVSIKRNDLEYAKIAKIKTAIKTITKEKEKLKSEISYYKLLAECIAKAFGDIVDEYNDIYSYLMKVPEDYYSFKDELEQIAPMFNYIFQLLVTIYSDAVIKND